MLPVLDLTASVQCLYNGMPAHFADSPKTEAVYKMLSVSQPSPAPETLAKLYRPASIVDKTHIHTRYCEVLLVKQMLPPENDTTCHHIHLSENQCFNPNDFTVYSGHAYKPEELPFQSIYD